MIQKFHEKLKNCSIEKLEIGLLWAKLILFFCWSYGFSSSCLDFRKLSFFFNFWNAYLDRIPILSSFGLYFLNPKQNIFFCCDSTYLQNSFLAVCFLMLSCIFYGNFDD
jgi:hypothetical protein